jgi:hypothetical protein
MNMYSKMFDSAYMKDVWIRQHCGQHDVSILEVHPLKNDKYFIVYESIYERF